MLAPDGRKGGCASVATLFKGMVDDKMKFDSFSGIVPEIRNRKGNHGWCGKLGGGLVSVIFIENVLVFISLPQYLACLGK